LIAAEVADDYSTIELDAQDLSMDAVRDFERMCYSRPLGNGCHCFLVNEAHGLSSKVVSRLQTVLELPAVQRNSTWIFTTTLLGQQRLFEDMLDCAPLLSRAIEIVFSGGRDTIVEMAVRAKEIAEHENLDDKPIAAYVELIVQEACNMRKVLQRIESGEMLTN
jgi:hypothetical protein